MTHQVHIPRFPRDMAFELEEWCDPEQSIDIMASLDGKRYGDDHILLQVTEDASRLVVKEMETETDGII
jgi:hypothetical protein